MSHACPLLCRAAGGDDLRLPLPSGCLGRCIDTHCACKRIVSIKHFGSCTYNTASTDWRSYVTNYLTCCRVPREYMNFSSDLPFIMYTYSCRCTVSALRSWNERKGRTRTRGDLAGRSPQRARSPKPPITDIYRVVRGGGGVCRWMTPQDVAVPHDTLHASVRPVTQIHHTHAHPLHRHTLHGHALHGHTLSTDTLSTDTLSRRTRAREVD